VSTSADNKTFWQRSHSCEKKDWFRVAAVVAGVVVRDVVVVVVVLTLLI
jgi:hypothetical protein